MKVFSAIFLLFLFTLSYSQEKKDSTRHNLKAGVTFSLNSNGIASIPAFSLDKPALIAAPILTKGRFSYEPVLAYGPDLKPWFIDNWLNYKIIDRPVFRFITGFNLSTFFSEYKFHDTTFLQGQRYFALAFTGIYKFTSNTSLTLAYWSDNGRDGGISGHYVNSMIERTEMQIGKNGLFAAAIQVFYINYDGNNDGLFVSPRLAYAIRNFPLSVFFQATQGIVSNIEPFPEFRWNIGLAYTL